MVTMFRVIGHDENDIYLFFESGVPLFAKRFSKATAGTQIDTRSIILVSVNKIDFVPQFVQDRNLPVTMCRVGGSLRIAYVLRLNGWHAHVGAYGFQPQRDEAF